MSGYNTPYFWEPKADGSFQLQNSSGQVALKADNAGHVGVKTGVLVNKLTRSTIANAGTVTDAQMAGGVLYQDASGGNVTMTTRTGTQIDAAYPTLPAFATGEGMLLRVASNHASNTSTIAGGTGVTLVGSGAVTNLGGTFLLIRTGTATYDLVRVG